MRKLAVLVILVGMALPALAAKRVTVAQLEQALAAVQGKSDGEVAGEISDMELSERLSEVRFARLESALPGEKARQALRLLADSSAFLDSPAADIPAMPAPNLAALKNMLTLTVNYVSQTEHRLPDFSATRVISSFEDTPAAGKAGWDNSTFYLPIHPVGIFTATVLYRDGREVVDVDAEKKKNHRPVTHTLTTAGVFGPILATVLVDAARSKLAWSRWQAGAAGPEAVFSYAVPIEKSHYKLNYGCNGDDSYSCSDHEPSPGKVVAYHGQIAIDPASGVILRLLLVADLRPEDFAVKSSIVVEYGPVEIGGKHYYCPVRSVAIAVEHAIAITPANQNPEDVLQPPLKTSLNDVAFGAYHMLRGDARVLSEAEAANVEGRSFPPQSGSDAAPSAANKLAPAPTGRAPAEADTSAVANPSASPTATAAASNPPTDSTASPSGASAPTHNQAEAEQEALLSKLPVYKTNARDVLVDVVVTKRNGDPALGLQKQDFELKEDGKAQAIDFFEEHTAKTLPRETSQPLPKLPPNTYTNAPPAPHGDSVNVLLLDTLNTAQQDQAYVHHEITDFLKKMRPGTRVAIFALGSKLRYVQGFTTDTSVLLAALNDKRNGAAAVKPAGTRDRSDQADDKADMARLTMMQSNGVGALEAAQADMAAIDFGARAAITFEALDHLANYLAGVPGRKNLIWFSSSFPVVIFPTPAQRKSIENSPAARGYLDQVKKTADLLTVSKVAVYPVSAEGVMTEHIGEADSAGPAALEGPGHMGSTPDGPGSNGTMSPFVAGSAERADTVAAMEQIAASTGGKAYFNTNDLNGALDRAINDGANYYTLSYSPADAKMDGSFRNIEVRLSKGHYTVAYRHGYNADAPSAVEAESGTDPLSPSMKLGLPSATGLLFGVRVVPVTPQPVPDAKTAGQNPKLEGPLTRYSVDFFIRSTDVDLQLNPQGEQDGQIELAIVAYDRNGNPVNWDSVTQAINLKADAFDAIQTSGIPAHMEIDLPSEDMYMVTGVFDRGGEKTGTLEIQLRPPSPTGR